MAGKQAGMAAGGKAVGGKVGGGSRLWVQGLVCGTVIAVAAPSVLLVAVLGLPGLLALLFDREPGRPIARNVLLFGAAVAMPSLAALWHAGRDWAACLDLLSDVGRVATAWALQAGGWLVGELAPLAVRAGMEATAAAQAARLRARRARYEEEGGLPPAPETGEPAAKG